MPKNTLQTTQFSRTQLAVSLLFGLIMSFFLQFYLLDPDYDSLRQSHRYSVATVDPKNGFLEENGKYISQYGSGSLDIDGANASAILIEFTEPNSFPQILQFFTTSVVNGEPVHDVSFPYLTSNSDFGYLPLEQQDYSEFTVDFFPFWLGAEFSDFYLGVNVTRRDPAIYVGAEEQFTLTIENIYLIHDHWSESQLLASKLQASTTILLLLVFAGLALLFFQYQEQGKRFLPYAILILFTFLYLQNSERSGDDAVLFLHMRDSYTLLEYSIMRIQVWNSRFFIEIFPYYLVHCMELWAFLTALLFALYCYSVERIFPPEHLAKRWYLVLLAFYFPIRSIGDVGWVATSTNYFWVVTMLLYQFIPLAYYCRGEKISKFLSISSLIACLYASNHEQGVCVVIGFYLVVFFYLHLQKRKFTPFYPHFIIAIASLIYHIISPANQTRKVTDVRNMFPEFANYSIWDKMEMAFTTTLVEITVNAEIYLYIFFISSMAILYLRYQHQKITTKEAIISNSLAAFSTFFGFGFFSLVQLYFKAGDITIPFLPNYNKIMSNTGLNETLSTFERVYAILLLVLFLFSLLATVFFLFYKELKGLFALICLCAALASRLIIGLSPGIIHGGDRTYIYFFTAFFVINIMLFDELFPLLPKKVKKILPYCAIPLFVHRIGLYLYYGYII